MLVAAPAAGFAPEGVLRAYLRERGRRLDVTSSRPSERPGAAGWALARHAAAGVRSPFEVYVNGVRQELGTDYRVSEGELVFERELVRQKLGRWAWFLGLLGDRDLQAQRRGRRPLRGRGRPTVAQGGEFTPPPA